MAELISTWSKDPSTQVGAVAVSDNKQVLSIGYNGFPRDVEDTSVRLNNRVQKYKYVVHAEQNCIYNACNNGVSLNNSTLYVYGLPICSDCAKGVIQTGVSTVVLPELGDLPDKWVRSYEITMEMFNEANVAVKEINYMQLQQNRL